MEERTERPERPAAAERSAPRRVAPPKKPRRRSVGVVQDPVSDMLTRLRNGSRARHETVTMPTSKLKAEIAKILKAEGFLAGYDVAGATLTCRMRYVDGKIPAISEIARVSTPGRRIYSGRRELPRVRRGLGLAIVSTSQGIMTNLDASKKGLGGEVLCAVW